MFRTCYDWSTSIGLLLRSGFLLICFARNLTASGFHCLFFSEIPVCLTVVIMAPICLRTKLEGTGVGLRDTETICYSGYFFAMHENLNFSFSTMFFKATSQFKRFRFSVVS